MRLKTNLLLILSALLLTMCRSYSEVELAGPIVGLDCRSFTARFEQGMGTSRGWECSYTCPNGTAISLDFENDPSLYFTKGDMDRLFCGMGAQDLATNPPASPSATLQVSETATVSTTPSPALQVSETVAISPAPQSSILTGSVSMCDLGARLINFRIVEPTPDLTEESLAILVQGQESNCYVNPTNPSVLTCSLPDDTIFPARIVVTLGGAVVNDFVFSGVGCSILKTPIPRIKSYP